MKILIILLIITILATVGVITSRKDMPYTFELVPRNGAVFAICTTEWNIKTTNIVVSNKNGELTRRKMTNQKKILILDQLMNDEIYQIKFSRADLIGKLRYRSLKYSIAPKARFEKYVVLVGASIGGSWKLNELHNRIDTKNVIYGYRGKYNYDKTNIIRGLINEQYKPDAVIIKECSAYFPRNIKESIGQLLEWISVLRKNGINPILATVVPVTEEKNKKNPEKMESINKFNSVLRKYAKTSNIAVLDLQKILSDKNKQMYLSEKYSLLDGYHLKFDTYKNLLDKKLVEFIQNNT